MAIMVIRRDSRLLGAGAQANVTAARCAVACAESRCVVMLNRQQGDAVVGASPDLGGEPGALLLWSSALWTITKPGTLVKLTTADTPAITLSVALSAATNSWLTSYSSVILAPGRVGGVVSLNASGSPLKYLDGILGRVAWAIADASGNLYCFDGLGHGAVVAVNGTTGAFGNVWFFTAQDCIGVLNGYILGTTLVVAAQSRNAVVSFSIADPTAVVRSARTTYDTSHYTVNAVRVADPALVPMTNEEYPISGISQWVAASSGIYSSATEMALSHGRTARVTWLGPAYAQYLLTGIVTNGSIYGSASSGDTLYICGDFTSVTGINGTLARNRVAAVDMSNGYVMAWNPNANGLVRAVAVDSSGVYLGGDFTTISGTARNYAAAVDASGSLLAWYPTLNGIVVTMVISSSIVYLGGNFTTVNGSGQIALCSFSTDGVKQSLSGSFTVGINDLEISGSTLYVACANETINTHVGAIHALDSTTGASLGGFVTPSAAGGTAQVQGIALYGGVLYAGGSFTSLAGVGRNYLAAISATTGAVASWNPNANNSVISGGVAVDDAGYIYAVGSFTTIGGAAQAYGVAIDSSGTTRAWPPVAMLAGPRGIAFHSARQILISGGPGDQFIRQGAP